jgi:hypothetical protein
MTLLITELITEKTKTKKIYFTVYAFQIRPRFARS